jgi:hypothetical protein
MPLLPLEGWNVYVLDLRMGVLSACVCGYRLSQQQQQQGGNKRRRSSGGSVVVVSSNSNSAAVATVQSTETDLGVANCFASYSPSPSLPPLLAFASSAFGNSDNTKNPQQQKGRRHTTAAAAAIAATNLEICRTFQSLRIRASKKWTKDNRWSSQSKQQQLQQQKGMEADLSGNERPSVQLSVTTNKCKQRRGGDEQEETTAADVCDDGGGGGRGGGNKQEEEDDEEGGRTRLPEALSYDAVASLLSASASSNVVLVSCSSSSSLEKEDVDCTNASSQFSVVVGKASSSPSSLFSGESGQGGGVEPKESLQSSLVGTSEPSVPVEEEHCQLCRREEEEERKEQEVSSRRETSTEHSRKRRPTSTKMTTSDCNSNSSSSSISAVAGTTTAVPFEERELKHDQLQDCGDESPAPRQLDKEQQRQEEEEQQVSSSLASLY